MQSIFIKKIRFGSYVKLNLVISIAIGIVFGVLFLIIGLFGGPVTANFGNMQFTGITAGILGLFICPVVFSLFGFMISLITYLPFIGAMKILKRVELFGDFACECENDFLIVEHKNDTSIDDNEDTDN